jgi:CDP-diacylglycerol--glycerol-3-phosphate 3-phosphatidyltransferase
MGKNELKLAVRARVRPLVLGLDRLGITPLAISLVGLFMSALSGLMVARGSLLGGGLVFLLGSGLDMLDGDLARLQGKVSPRGAFLDSCFDRLGEAALFAGLIWYMLVRLAEPHPVVAMLAVATLVGSLMTSYARARAEGLAGTCLVGFLQRPERIVLLVAGLWLGRVFGWRLLAAVLALLAVATMATTLQRLVHVARNLPGPEGPAAAGRAKSPEELP